MVPKQPVSVWQKMNQDPSLHRAKHSVQMDQQTKCKIENNKTSRRKYRRNSLRPWVGQ